MHWIKFAKHYTGEKIYLRYQLMVCLPDWLEIAIYRTLPGNKVDTIPMATLLLVIEKLAVGKGDKNVKQKEGLTVKNISPRGGGWGNKFHKSGLYREEESSQVSVLGHKTYNQGEINQIISS